MATSKDALNNNSGVEFGLVLVIEGYEKIIVDHSVAAALTAWVADGWTEGLDGLSVDGEFRQIWEPFAGGLDVGVMSFVVKGQGGDELGALMMKRDSGEETLLDDSVGPDDATIPVRSTAGFDSPAGIMYIGTEAISYTNVTATTFTGCIRGIFAPFKAGTESVKRFGHPHSVTTDVNAVTRRPTVSQEPRTWRGKWVGLYLHRIVGGVWDTVAEASLRWAGRIADFEDQDDGSIRITCEDSRAKIRDTTLMHSPFRASVQDGFYLQEGWQIYAQEFTIGTPGVKASTLEVIAEGGTPADAREITAGYYTLEGLTAVINVWLNAAVATFADLIATWELSRIDTNEGPRTRIEVDFADGAALSRNYKFYFKAGTKTGGATPGGETIMDILGFGGQMGTKKGDFTGLQIEWDDTSDASGVLETEYIGEHPRKRITMGLANQAGLAKRRVNIFQGSGEWIDTTALAPQPHRSNLSGTDWGFAKIGNVPVIVERLDPLQFEVNRSASRLIQIQLGLGVIEDPVALDGEESSITFEQIAIFRDTLQNIISQITYSTDGSGYNDSTEDTLPSQLGAAIPSEILGSNFDNSLAALSFSGSNLATTVLIDRPTKFEDILMPELILRAAYLALADGQFRFVQPSSPKTTFASFIADTSNIATPTNTDDPAKPLVRYNADRLINVFKIEYGRDFAGEYADSITIRHQGSIDDYGESRPVTIRARNLFSGGAAGQVAEALASDFRAYVAPIYARPIPTVEIPVAHTLYQAAPGDVVTVTHPFIRDPQTGLRGVTNLPGQVIGSRHILGGEGATNTGTLVVTFIERDKSAVYAPCAKLDQSAGGTTGGYDAGTPRVVCLANEYSEPGTDADATQFDAGDEILIVESDPNVPGQELSWERTVDTGSTGNEIRLTATLTSPTFDPAKFYNVYSREYSAATSTQRVDCYMADDADDLIEDLVPPYEYGRGSSFQIDTVGASADEEAEFYSLDQTVEGSAKHPAFEHALCRTANNLVERKTAPQMPFLSDAQPLVNFALGASGIVDGWGVCAIHMLYAGVSQLQGKTRKLYMAPQGNAVGADTMLLRVTASPWLPTGADGEDMTFAGSPPQVVWSTTTNTEHILSTQSIVPSINGATGICYLIVEGFRDATRNFQFRGFGKLYWGPYE